MQENLPRGWIKTKLENTVEILDGKRIPINSRERQQRQGIIPYYGATGRVGWIDDYIFDQELVLLGEDGAPFFENFKDKSYIIFGKSWVNNHAHVLKGISELLLNYFLCHFLNQVNYHNYVNGTTRLKLNQTSMKTILIILPPLNEQKRIVSKIESIFSQIDAGKEKLEDVRKLLRQARQSVLKSAFEGKLTERWRESNPSELDIDWFDYDHMKNIENNKNILNEIITISDEYCWIDFNIIINSMKNGIYKPQNFYSDKGIACLRMYNIENNKISWKKIKRMILTTEEISEYLLLPNDILINRVNSLELVGKSALIPEGLEDCIFESKNIRLRIETKNMDPKYVYFWLTIGGKHYFYKNFQQTTGMAYINQTQLGDLPIPYCNINEQKRIVSKIESIFGRVDAINNIFYIITHMMAMMILMLIITLMNHEYHTTKENIQQ